MPVGLEKLLKQGLRPRRAGEPRGGDRRRRARITADTALRLSRYFGITAKLWINLQSDYDLQAQNSRRSRQRLTEAYARPLLFILLDKGNPRGLESLLYSRQRLNRTSQLDSGCLNPLYRAQSDGGTHC